MSFSSDIKEEICKVISYKNKKVLEGELLGYLLSANTSDKDEYLEFITENEFNIERFYKILFNLEIDYEPRIEGKHFVATIEKYERIDSILPLANSSDEEVLRAIVKGAFLGSRICNRSK